MSPGGPLLGLSSQRLTNSAMPANEPGPLHYTAYERRKHGA